MEVPESDQDPVDKSAGEPDRKRMKKDTELDIMIETGVVKERFKCCWEQILSYLPPRLDDVFALFQSCSYLRSIVETFLASDNSELMIDGDCLVRYPLSGCGLDHLYERIGPLVHTLTVYKVTKHELKELSLIFSYIRNLHLERVLILDENKDILFPHLLSLKLTECVIHTNTMTNILNAVNSDLHLHVKRSTIQNWLANLPWTDSKMVIPKHLLPRPRSAYDRRTSLPNYNKCPSAFIKTDMQRFKHFSELICEGAHVILNGHSANSIRIVDCDGKTTLSSIIYKAPKLKMKLKSLSLETRDAIEDLVKNAATPNLQSLEVLTLTHLPAQLNWLGGLKKLKQLRILRPIENYQQVALIETLSAMKKQKKIAVTYNGVFPEPAVDQIINVLNEDCLREIVTYLDLEAVFNLAIVHTRFKEVVSSMDVSSFGIIDRAFLMQHPPHQQLIGYEALGHSLTTLSLADGYFAPLMPCFPHLLRLQIEHPDSITEAVPQQVEELNVECEWEISKDSLMKLLYKLQPTLKVLQCHHKCDDYEFLQHLSNLTELDISREALNGDLRAFFKRNQSLEVLSFTDPPSHDYHSLKERPNYSNQQRNWEVIATLTNLSVLKITSKYIRFATKVFPKMEQVKELSLVGLFDDMYHVILNFFGKNLEILTVSDGGMVWSPIIFRMILGYKNLRSFEFDYPLSVSNVIQLMIKHPKLSLITNKHQMSFYEDLAELENFLSAENRVLYLNGVKYPSWGRTPSRQTTIERKYSRN